MLLFNCLLIKAELWADWKFWFVLGLQFLWTKNPINWKLVDRYCNRPVLTFLVDNCPLVWVDRGFGDDYHSVFPGTLPANICCCQRKSPFPPVHSRQIQTMITSSTAFQPIEKKREEYQDGESGFEVVFFFFLCSKGRTWRGGSFAVKVKKPVHIQIFAGDRNRRSKLQFRLQKFTLCMYPKEVGTITTDHMHRFSCRDLKEIYLLFWLCLFWVADKAWEPWRAWIVELNLQGLSAQGGFLLWKHPPLLKLERDDKQMAFSVRVSIQLSVLLG